MLCAIVKNTYDKDINKRKGNNLGLVNDKEELLYVKERIDGSTEYIFSLDTIRIFDEMVFNNDKKLYSPEQHELMTSYLQEEISEKNTALDVYLAGFFGVTDSSYTYCREGEQYEQQLHRKCKQGC